MKTANLQSIQIRPAMLDDLQQIAEIKIDSQHVSDHLHPVDWVMQELFIREFKKRWKQRLQEGISTLILSDDNNLIGFISYSTFADARVKAGHTAEISNLYVLPSKRRQRLGTLLCNAALDKVREEKFQHAVVWLPECSHQTMNFYESIGFQATANVRKDIIRDQVVLKEVRYQIVLKIT